MLRHDVLQLFDGESGKAFAQPIFTVRVELQWIQHGSRPSIPSTCLRSRRGLRRRSRRTLRLAETQSLGEAFRKLRTFSSLIKNDFESLGKMVKIAHAGTVSVAPIFCNNSCTKLEYEGNPF